MDDMDPLIQFLQSQLTMKRRMVGPARKPKGLIVPGNILNLYNRPVTQSPAGPEGVQPGNWSTTLSKSFNLDGREVLLPTVVGGKFMTDREAVERYMKTGQHLGMFDTPENADAFAIALHQSQEAMGNWYGRVSNK